MKRQYSYDDIVSAVMSYDQPTQNTFFDSYSHNIEKGESVKQSLHLAPLDAEIYDDVYSYLDRLYTNCKTC